MERKAKFLYAYKDRDWQGHFTGRTELTYEYRGHEYTIVDFGWTGLGSGSESLYAQHQAEQDAIDAAIESKKRAENQPKQSAEEAQAELEAAIADFFSYFEEE